MNLKPLGGNVIVKVSDAKETSKGGIILPNAGSETRKEGVAVAVGRGRQTNEGALIVPEVSVGDTVVFAHYGVTDITSDGEDYLIVPDQSILAIVG